MNRILLVLLVSTLLGCSKSQPECNSDIVKSTLKQIVYDKFEERLNQKLSTYNLHNAFLFKENNFELEKEKTLQDFKKFVDISFETVRTTSKNENIRKCNCETYVNFNANKTYEEEWKKVFIRVNKGTEYEIDTTEVNSSLNQKDFLLNRQIELIYDAQFTDDSEDVYVTALFDEDFNKKIVAKFIDTYSHYLAIENLYKNGK